MDWLKILQQIFEVCIIPLLGILTTTLIQFVIKKKNEVKEKTENETLKKYLDMLAETIETCVIATNQTYVEALKDKNAFDAEAQKHAFEMTYQNVMALLSEEAKRYLQEAIGDLTLLITQGIEQKVNEQK